ncbi:MAG: hypothetical protein IJX84_07310 [Clostridia bacterium]|nr:hypothetical protein [Clostridia bacterium]MBQ8654686.1 hypothetical protein [Clostridia bacterium]
MKYRPLLCIIALLLTGVVIWFALSAAPARESIPGTDAAQRRLVRIWVCSSVGGGESWLRDCLKTWEKQNPGAMTFLRTVSPEEITKEDAVLPDILLYTPGAITAPQDAFMPLSNITGIREPLLRAGRWQMQQYGLPLCYAGYALAIDSAAEPQLAATPAPTTLLGKPAATLNPDATATPGLPQGVTLIAPKGCGLFTLGCLLTERPALAEDFATTDPADIYRRFQARQATAALLTTGQITALNGVFPFRVITPSEVITDQVWLASIFPGADDAAAELLQYLTSAESQRKLSKQSLHTVREDLRLYATGTEALMETAAARALTVINAYIPAADVEAAAWQFFHGREGISEALMPLL